MHPDKDQIKGIFQDHGICSIYYSHSMRIYGSDRSDRELGLIKIWAGDLPRHSYIFNPEDYGKLGMGFYLALSARSDYFFFSTYKGHIGKGVYEELREALSNRSRVFRLRWDDHLTFTRFHGSAEINDRDDWAVRYAKITE